MTFDPSQLEIVHTEDAERIFEALSLTEIAEAWLSYQTTKDDRDWWAVDLMWSDPYLRDRDRREKFIELLIETAPDDLLGNAAAGPLEDAIYDADECVSGLKIVRQRQHASSTRSAWSGSGAPSAQRDSLGSNRRLDARCRVRASG